jgi:hypothetical protein
VQYVLAGGGWAEGDNSFHAPERPQDAAITYYQRTRHIYGDLTGTESESTSRKSSSSS